MKTMLIGILLFLLLPLSFGSERERAYDILHFKADLGVNFEHQELSGIATIDLILLSDATRVSFDGINLDVISVMDSEGELFFENDKKLITVKMRDAVKPYSKTQFKIKYSCKPKGGFYFHESPYEQGKKYAFSWGEGGLHANWLPIYNDLNDKFTSEMIIRVPTGYEVVSNGKLLEKTLLDSEAVFHWKQSNPHANYLISLYIGPFKNKLIKAGSIPISYWVPDGFQEHADNVFSSTPAIMDYYTQYFEFSYPWEKYDQITVPAYGPGAMEHTTVTGHDWCILRGKDESIEFFPTHDEITSDWTIETIVSHELVHHWVGNTTTAKNLSYIWLNESLATYMALLWVQKAQGESAFRFYLDLARRHYFDYYRVTKTERPLEFHDYRNRDGIFEIPVTYLKGASIVHMLKTEIGDEQFRKTMVDFVQRNKFGNVDTHDFLKSISISSGRNLDSFKEEWIQKGGHPEVSVNYSYLADEKIVDLKIHVKNSKGIQPEVILFCERGVIEKKLSLVDGLNNYFISVPSAPKCVSFDGSGDFLASVQFDKSFDELSFQLRNDSLSGQLWALDQISSKYSDDPRLVGIFIEVLKGDFFWGLKAACLVNAGNLNGVNSIPIFEHGTKSNEYHVRKGAALGLGNISSQESFRILKQLLDDPNTAVVSTALLSTCKSQQELKAGFFADFLNKESWSDEIKIAALRCLGLKKDVSFLDHVKKYVKFPYNHFVQQAALQAWIDIKSDDPLLHAELVLLSDSPILGLQLIAINSIGSLHLENGRSALESIVENGVDSNMVEAARGALAELNRVRDGVSKTKNSN